MKFAICFFASCFAAAVAVTACTSGAQGAEQWNVTKVNAIREVYDIRLKDNTRCVVYSGPKQGGITCDWSTGENQTAHRSDSVR